MNTPSRASQRSLLRQSLVVAALWAVGVPLVSQAAVSLAIDIAPPPIPVYVQPVIPSAGYLWTPGYWRWSPADGEYFWVPGTWVAPPYVGALWTPGYWGWGNGVYRWHGGYWGNHIGFYGGVNYGFGYVGHGYAGGYWTGGVFNYNRSVNNVNTTIVHNVYNTTVVENGTRVSYNGGQGGVAARPSREEQEARAEPHTPPTALQHRHEQVAMRTPAQRVSFNHGTPQMAATAQPGAMRAGGHPGAARPHVAGMGARPMQGRPGPQAHREMRGEHGGAPREGGGRAEHREGQPH